MFNKHLKKQFTYSDGNPIWRVIVAGNEKLLLETRDVDKKEAYYHCIDIAEGKTLWEDFQLDEKYWTGIEEADKETVYFHNYAKPDMPEHKGITAVDIGTLEVVWRNGDLVFLFVWGDLVYAYRQKFESQDFFALDKKTGHIVKELGDDFELISELQDKAERAKDYSLYNFPEKYYGDIEPDEIKNVIGDTVRDIDIIGGVEYTVSNGLIMISFHQTVKGKIDNHFIVVDAASGKKVFGEKLNTNSDAVVVDSFFIYNGILFLIKEKTTLLAYNIKQ